MANAIAILRVFWGLVFFSNGLSKFVPSISRLPHNLGFLINSADARGIIVSDVRHHPLALYRELVLNFFVPHWDVFGPLLGGLEMLAGALLILGLAAPLGALLAALLSAHVQLADLFNGPWVFEYAVEWVTLLCLVFMRPGRYRGLDAWVWERRRRLRRLFA